VPRRSPISAAGRREITGLTGPPSLHGVLPGLHRIRPAGCTLIPTTDEGTPAAFYPFFSAFQNGIQDEQGNGQWKSC
jgi:hypothetical protein